MGEVVNLRRARKAKAQTSAQVTAAANRALHGQTKAERHAQEADHSRLNRALDGARLEDREG